MTEHDKRVMVIMSCNHTNFFDPPPSKGDEVYCMRCGTFRTVEIAVAQWRAKCQHKGCRFSVRTGDDSNAARRAAIKHVGRYQDHKVFVLQGDRVDSSTDVSDETIPGTLPDRYHIVTVL